MTITQLQYVLAVAEYRNFTLAAEKSFVTQPTLSMQVQKLEDELDILIFDRSKKPISITDVGQKIIDQAKNIVAEAERIKDIVDQDKGFIGGDYTLGIIPTVMPTLLPMFLNTFIKKYPKVNLIIKEQSTDTEGKEEVKEEELSKTKCQNPKVQSYFNYIQILKLRYTNQFYNICTYKKKCHNQ